ncbi:phosphatase [Cytophagales bacterium RKSG123]|nr:phosphatase [Xanthovirga aplysinae]
MKNFYQLSLIGLIILSSCNDKINQGGEPEEVIPVPVSEVEFKAHSISPNFLKLTSEFSSVDVYPILSSEDQLEESPNFIYGSMADGAGLLKNEDGTYTLINNIEADFSIARITFDKTFKPVKGEYILNAIATVATAQCSGSLITPEEHGFGPFYLSGGEWGGSSNGVFITDPYKDPVTAFAAEMLPAFGQWVTENAVLIGQDAFPGKTVAFIGDNQGENDIPSGQLGMYVGDHGDLRNGKLYGLQVTDENIMYEMDMEEGKSYPVEFVELGERLLEDIDEEAKNKGVMGFSRVEDLDWRRGSAKNNREVYFCVTGRDKPDLHGKGTISGRVYKVVLNEEDPTKAGTITCVLDGDILGGKAESFHSPDNILVTENYAYIQEDPNGISGADKEHFARLYQYDLKKRTLKTVLECDQLAAIEQGYGTTKSWEITGMIDISETIGEDNSFLLITQNHGWVKGGFTDPAANPDVSRSNEGSMLYLIKGLDR